MLSKFGIEIFTFIIFALAIIHAFLTHYFYALHEKYKIKANRVSKQQKFYLSLSEICYFFSEIEIVFGFWIIPLVLGLFLFLGVQETLHYLTSRDYTYALYMAVVVAFVSTRPIIQCAERLLAYISRLGGNSVKTWWWTILTLGPFLDIFLKEPGAMTITSILMAKTCFPFVKSRKFRYGTLALLFLNISLGGLFSPYTSRSLFLVAQLEKWDLAYTLMHFSWKALIVILLNTGLTYFVFRKKFPKDSSALLTFLENEKREHIPIWLTIIHLGLFLAIILSSEYPPIFLGVFFIFIGIHKVTHHYQGHEQGPLQLKPAIAVGFFFASLLIHGELQEGWVLKFLSDLNFEGALAISTFLSSIIDNAIVLYFLDQIKPLKDPVLYAIIAGSLSAAALTVMANGPNLIGYTILKKFFGGNISPFQLFLAGLPLTILSLLIFWVLL